MFGGGSRLGGLPAKPCRRPGPLWLGGWNRDGSDRCGGAQGHGHDYQRQHRADPRSHGRRRRLLLNSECARGQVRHERQVDRVSPLLGEGSRGLHQHGQACKPQPTTGAGHRIGHGGGQRGGPPDDEIGCQCEPGNARDGEPASFQLPQLPDPHQSGSRRHTGTVSERRGRYARALLVNQHQRPAARRQQHPCGRFCRYPGHDASPRGVRPAGGKRSGGQHLHQQLRCRAGHDGRRRRHRGDQVRDQRFTRQPLCHAQQ